MEFLNLSHREKSNGARAREGGEGEIDRYRERERERKGEGVERGAGEESERCPQHYGTQSMKSHRLKR